jgi:hypothetical protein
MTQEQQNALKTMRLRMAVENILETTRETYNQLVNVQRRGIDMVWNNPSLTPQEIVDALGEDAVKVFEFHGALTTFVQQLATAANVDVDLKTPTNAFSVLSGNIVISDQPYTA